MAGQTHLPPPPAPAGLIAEQTLAGEAARDLDAALIAAHDAGDGARLVGLYTAAAERAEREGRCDAAGFFLTHAYVFALEAGHPAAGHLHARLKAAGREE